MAAEVEGLPSTKFRYPAWYHFRAGGGDNYCRTHYVCRQVDRDLRLLHNKPPLKKDDDYYYDDIDDHEEEEEGDIVYPINIFSDQEKEVEEQSHNQNKNKNKEEEPEEEKKNKEEEQKEKEEEKEEEEEEEKEKKGVIDYSVKLVGPDHRAMKEKWTIQMGRKKYNLRQLLSSPSRDYLIKFNGDKVSIDQLSGKHVLLYFWYLSAGKLGNKIFNTDLEDVYRIYNSQGEFEAVFVALGNNEIVFREAFSGMSWLAIPHEDQEARDLFVTKFAKPFSPFGRAVLFAPDGKVLLEDSKAAFRAYGPEGFPFTKKRMDQIEREDNALWKELSSKELSSSNLSLTALLGDYLISSEGSQVQTSELEGKVVGLYFIEASPLGHLRTSRLVNIWKASRSLSFLKNFEIVIIDPECTNLSCAKAEFKAKYGDIPWYSLLSDGRKLCRVLKVSSKMYWHDGMVNAGYFITLMPGRSLRMSYFAFDIMDKFGLDAYPFDLDTAVMLTKRTQMEDLMLVKILYPRAPLRRGSSTNNKEVTTVSHLLWKHWHVLLLFATHSCYGSGSFMPELKRMYHESIGTNYQFEIIYMSLDCEESPSSFSRSIQEMPWLIHPSDSVFAVSLAKKVFGFPPPHLPAIAAFSADGHLLTKESNLAFKKEWNSEYPFIQADMGEDVRRELINRYKWDL